MEHGPCSTGMVGRNGYSGGDRNLPLKYVVLAKEVDTQVAPAAGADLDRGNNTIILHDDCLPGNESVESVPDLQLVTTLAKTFLHDSSPWLPHIVRLVFVSLNVTL